MNATTTRSSSSRDEGASVACSSPSPSSRRPSAASPGRRRDSSSISRSDSRVPFDETLPSRAMSPAALAVARSRVDATEGQIASRSPVLARRTRAPPGMIDAQSGLPGIRRTRRPLSALTSRRLEYPIGERVALLCGAWTDLFGTMGPSPPAARLRQRRHHRPSVAKTSRASHPIDSPMWVRAPPTGRET